jgi:hypothetical protein
LQKNKKEDQKYFFDGRKKEFIFFKKISPVKLFLAE